MAGNAVNKSTYTDVSGYKARVPLNMSNHMRSPLSYAAPAVGGTGFRARPEPNVTRAKVGIPGGGGGSVAGIAA